jgi:hypothetical protein
VETGVRTVTIKQYQIDHHPEPQKCVDWVRDNWHDLFDMEECLNALHKFAELFGCEVKDWSIGLGAYSYVTLTQPEIAIGLEGKPLWEYFNDTTHSNGIMDTAFKDGPLTGMCADEWLLDPFRAFMGGPDDISLKELLQRCADNWLRYLLEDWADTYSDEHLTELIHANEYWFNEDGSFAN